MAYGTFHSFCSVVRRFTQLLVKRHSVRAKGWFYTQACHEVSRRYGATFLNWGHAQCTMHCRIGV